MSLIDILAQILEVRPLTVEDAESGPYETLNGRRGRKAQAIEQYNRLKRAYTNEFMRTAAFIVVVGSKREEFVTNALTTKCISKDPEEYFANIVNKISPNLYLGKESVANLFDIVGRHIEDSAEPLGIVGYPQLIFRQEYQRSLANKEQFQSLIKQAIVNQLGGEIVGIQAINSLTDDAIAQKISTTGFPVLLSTGDDRFGYKLAEDLRRINRYVFLVKAGETSVAPTQRVYATLEEVTKEETKKTLRNIKNLTQSAIAQEEK